MNCYLFTYYSSYQNYLKTKPIMWWPPNALCSFY